MPPFVKLPKTPCLIVLDEKHHTYHFYAPDQPGLEARLLTIVRGRLKAGYYEGSTDAVAAQAVVKARDGLGALNLLERRTDAEYEGFKLSPLDSSYIPS